MLSRVRMIEMLRNESDHLSAEFGVKIGLFDIIAKGHHGEQSEIGLLVE